MKRVLFILLTLIIVSNSCSDRVSSFEDHLLKARQYKTSKKLDKAIKEYKKALRLNPASAEAHYELGEVYYEKWEESFQQAQRKYLQSIFMNPKSAPSADISKKELDKVYESFGERKEYKEMAMKEFKESLKYAPNNWRARYFIATHYLNEELHDEAIKEFEQIIKLNSKYVNAYSLLGEAYYEKGLYKKAIEKFKEAIILDPNSEIDRYNLALTYLKINNKRKALEELQELKRMKSDFYKRLKAKIAGQSLDFTNK